MIKDLKNIIFIGFLFAALTISPAWSTTISGPRSLLPVPIEQPIVKKRKKGKFRAPMRITPGSQVIMFKDKTIAEIRPDKSVWWFGVNSKKALMADGVHELKDGQKIKTKGGKLVGKNPRPMPKEMLKIPGR
jgi:hypothetical protein